MEIVKRLDEDLLKPQYTEYYVQLDTAYLDYNTNELITEIKFPLALTGNPQDYRNTILLKNKISNIIKMKILPFQIGQYYVRNSFNNIKTVISPLSQMILCSINSIVETYYKVYDSSSYTLLLNCQYKDDTFDGTNGSYMTKIIPTDNEPFIFRFPINSLDDITITLNDQINPIGFLNPYVNGTLTPGATTTITFSDKHYLSTGHIILLTTAITENDTINIELLDPNGFIVTVTGEYTITIAYDTSTLINPTYSIDLFIPNRRAIIPIILYQLRQEVAQTL